LPIGTRLYDPDANVRTAAMRALGRAADSPERRALVEQLRAELLATTALRRRYAAEALGLIKDSSSVPRLIDMVKHSDAAVAGAAKKALVEITQQDFGGSRWRWRGWWEKHGKKRDKR
jgi:HEAT repeat protein